MVKIWYTSLFESAVTENYWNFMNSKEIFVLNKKVISFDFHYLQIQKPNFVNDKIFNFSFWSFFIPATRVYREAQSEKLVGWF